MRTSAVAGYCSECTTAASLFAAGAAISLFTGRSAALSGLRMVAIGGGAGLTTWLIGRLIGVGLG